MVLTVLLLPPVWIGGFMARKKLIRRYRVGGFMETNSADFDV